MKSINIIALLLFSAVIAKSQITKRNWLVGGNAALAHTSNNSSASSIYKNTTISISPNIGYFAWDKFCTGIKLSVLLVKNNFPANSGGGSISYSTKSQFYNLGPFIRYYFLKPENRANILVESSYQYQFRKDISPGSDSKLSANIFMISAGPVIYFNSSVGVEFTIGYSSQKYSGITGSNNTIQTSIGLQVHLQKED